MGRTSTIFLGLLAAVSMQVASAGVVLTSNRADIGAGYVVDWNSLGGEGTTVNNGTVVGDVTVSGSSSTFTVFSGATFNANFLPTDGVLALFDMNAGDVASGQFTINFAAPVKGAGAQVQANQLGAFSGFISAYDAGHNLLGSVAVNGTTGNDGNGSAVFAGLVSTGFDISSLEFTGFGDGAGINALSVWSVDNQVAEPPAVLALLGYLGLMAGVQLRRRRG